MPSISPFLPAGSHSCLVGRNEAMIHVSIAQRRCWYVIRTLHLSTGGGEPRHLTISRELSLDSGASTGSVGVRSGIRPTR